MHKTLIFFLRDDGVAFVSQGNCANILRGEFDH